jgi:hypothetical protein
MNLDEIQEMWQRDSVIDPDNLHDESLKIPQLHAKYYTIYNTITLLREKARETYSKVNLKDTTTTQERHQQRSMKKILSHIKSEIKKHYRGTWMPMRG